ncbi:SprT family zinc-dependent metalloprotease [Methanosarcina sp.]|uniref:M48 family metallopeptidase n=1 Tax=Methanosarcina sp. TaxID=2213 RepID=UPI002988B5E4|nr:SprT family zinc-dependent metalloprotease [Methanosarcina sp.]MDW5551483.1 SprT family zinc-dependent metalloprotease [Methanosarcina sp.]MDW5554397.1 SprT family zinc-dependent metalloprotease [Methanosarcina sp.]MDW5560618.1 SprT family zinc-dependent metalloprotease [Methanosarcina sp.]
MTTQIKLGDITVDVVFKDIKNIHLSVNPPAGRVKISAPLRMNIDTIRVFVIFKIGWIKKKQKKFQEQERETPRQYLDLESHYVWGRRYLLKIIEINEVPSIELKHKMMILRVRPGADDKKKQAIIDAWYRDQLKKAVPPIIATWEPIMGVKVERFFVQRMKTKWGSCNHKACSIRLNTELAKKPKECLEYTIVHEMTHLLEPTHNARFITLMDQFMPFWQFCKNKLNQLPVSHEEWVY